MGSIEREYLILLSTCLNVYVHIHRSNICPHTDYILCTLYPCVYIHTYTNTYIQCFSMLSKFSLYPSVVNDSNNLRCWFQFSCIGRVWSIIGCCGIIEKGFRNDWSDGLASNFIVYTVSLVRQKFVTEMYLNLVSRQVRVPG